MTNDPTRVTRVPTSPDESTKQLPLVVLSGASRGIGRATAIELGRRGARLALIGRNSAAQAETHAALTELSIDYGFYDAELEEAASVIGAARSVLEQQGVPDAVINNAATIDRAPVELMSLGSWDRQLAVNLRAPFLLVSAFLPAMRARHRGRFVQVASIAATLGTANASAYCASKWGLVGFTKSLAEELRDSGLSAVAILPGSVDTEMLVGSGFAPRMTAAQVAETVAHFALIAPIAHNGASIEMYGV
ncbi:MAG TPA: SDR family oxidoreductase [Polyangiaceae bacterium]